MGVKLRWRDLAMALSFGALGLAACPRGRVPARPPDEGFAQPPPPAEPAPRDPAASPSRLPAEAECPAGPPTGACPSFGQTCRYENTWCGCRRPCTGAEPEHPEPNTWQCQTRDPDCPDAVPAARERCRPTGLRCGYGTCGGASAVCERGHWTVFHHGPPA